MKTAQQPVIRMTAQIPISFQRYRAGERREHDEDGKRRDEAEVVDAPREGGERRREKQHRPPWEAADALALQL